MSERPNPPLDYELLFKAFPGSFLVLSPELSLLAISDDLVAATLADRENILGRSVFDVFTADPDDSSDFQNWRISLEKVIRTGGPVAMPLIRYGVRRADSTEVSRTERHWRPIHFPVHSADGSLKYIIHRTEEVTQPGPNPRGSENYFRSLVDTSPAILWITGPDGYCSYLSKQWYEKTGQRSDQGVGFGWLDATHPDDKDSSGKVFVEANAAHTEFVTTYRLKQKNGEYRWAIDAGNPHFGPDGTYLGMVGTVVDIHDLRQAQVDLNYSRGRFERVLKSTEVGVWYCDLPFDVLVWDERVKEHFWLPPEAHVTIEIFYERIHPEDRQRTRESIDRSVSNREGYEIHYRTVDPQTGQIRWVRAIGAATYDESGNPTRFDGITMDITGQMEVRKALEESRERLEQAVRSRDEFLSIASHELKTPVTSLKMQLQMTRRAIQPEVGIAPSPEKLSKTLDLCIRQVDRLTALIEDLLDVSRVESGKMTYSFEPVDLSGLVKEVTERFAEQSLTAQSPIQVTASHKVVITCDPFRIEQVVTNLLTNAIKYGAESLVEVEVTHSPNEAVIKISDQGLGISRDKHAKIFDRFERAISHHNISGLGLGLYISKQIVDAHGGSIELESDLGKGSTFTVFLPFFPKPRIYDEIIER